MFRYAAISTNGSVYVNVNGASTTQTVNAWVDMSWTYVTNDSEP